MCCEKDKKDIEDIEDIEDIDHEYTDEIVCPFCGYKFSDSWECSSNEEDLGLIECYECEKSFYASRHVEVTYVTEKANYGTCKNCKTDNIVVENYNSSIGKYDGLCVKCGIKEKTILYNEHMENIKNRFRKDVL